MKDYADFACDNCGIDISRIGEYNYMVTARTWQRASGRSLLCVGCIEQRLGRELTADDFSHAPMNMPGVHRSDRLKARLAGKEFLRNEELPRHQAIRAFLDHLGIEVDVAPIEVPHYEPPCCRVTIRRGELEARAIVQQVQTSREDAIEYLDHVAQLRWDDLRPAGLPAGMRANHQRRAGEAELVMRQLFSPEERQRFRELTLLPIADHVLPGTLGARSD